MDSLPSVVMHSDLVMDQFNRLYAQLCGGSADPDAGMDKALSREDEEVPATDSGHDEAYDDTESEGPQAVDGGIVMEEDEEDEEGKDGARKGGDRDGPGRRSRRREENERRSAPASMKPQKAQRYASDEEQEQEPLQKQAKKQERKQGSHRPRPQERRSEQKGVLEDRDQKPQRPKHRPSALEMLFGAGEEEEQDEGEFPRGRGALAPGGGVQKGGERNRGATTKAPEPAVDKEEGRSKTAAKSAGSGRGQGKGAQSRAEPRPHQQPPLQEAASKRKHEAKPAALGPANILVPRKRQRDDKQESEVAAPKGGSGSKKRPREDSGSAASRQARASHKGRVPSREEEAEEKDISESEEGEDSEEEEGRSSGKAATKGGKGRTQGQRERGPPAAKKGADRSKTGAQAKKAPAKQQASGKQKQAKSPSGRSPAAVANGRQDGPTGKAIGPPQSGARAASKSPAAAAQSDDVWRWDGDESEEQEREQPRRRPPPRPLLSPQAPEEVADAWSPCVPSVDAYSADTLRLSLQRHPHSQAQHQPPPQQPSNSGGKKRPRDAHGATDTSGPSVRKPGPAGEQATRDKAGATAGGSFFQRLGNRPAPEQRPAIAPALQSTQPRSRPALPTPHPSPAAPQNPPSSSGPSTGYATLKPPPFSPPAALRSPLPQGSNAKVSPIMPPPGGMAGWRRGGGTGTPSPASSTSSWSVPSPAPHTLPSTRRPMPSSDPLLLGTLFSPRPRFLPHQAPSLTSPSPLPRLTAFPPPPPSLFNLPSAPGARK